jgi:hypothetical protein
MTFSTAAYPVSASSFGVFTGPSGPSLGESAESSRIDGVGSESPRSFERLVRLLQSNERLFAEQTALLARIRAARAYLAQPDRNLKLGQVHLEHLRAKYSGVLAHLRANRLEANSLLERLDGVAD